MVQGEGRRQVDPGGDGEGDEQTPGCLADGAGGGGGQDDCGHRAAPERATYAIGEGNSYYVDDIRRAKSWRSDSTYVDVGTSGGVWGASKRGYYA